MKKVLITCSVALALACMLNVRLATKNNSGKTGQTVSLNKALADGEYIPTPEPSFYPDDQVAPRPPDEVPIDPGPPVTPDLPPIVPTWPTGN